MDRTDDRYDLATGSLVPTQRTQFRNSFSQFGGHYTTDRDVDGVFNVNEVSADGFGGWQEWGDYNIHTNRHNDGIQHANEMYLLTGSLEGPLAGTMTGTHTGSNGGIANLDTADDYSGERHFIDWSPIYGGIRHEEHSTGGSSQQTTHDGRDWNYQRNAAGEYPGYMHYSGTKSVTGTDTTFVLLDYFETDPVTWVFAFVPYDGQTSYDVTIHTSDTDVQEPIPFFGSPSVPITPYLASPGPVWTAVPAVAGVAELQTGVSNTAAQSTTANAARDQAFTELSADAETLVEDDENGEPPLTVGQVSEVYAKESRPEVAGAPNTAAIVQQATVALKPVGEKPQGFWAWLWGSPAAPPTQPIAPTLPIPPNPHQIRRQILSENQKHLTPQQLDSGRAAAAAAKELQSTLADNTPIGGAINSLIEFWTGKNTFTHSELSDTQRVLGVAGAAGGPLGAAGDAAGKSRRAVRAVDNAADAASNAPVKTVGQIHHVISTKVARAVDDHPILSGLFAKRDSRFVTQAVDGAAHRGYQRWRRDLDKEVAEWIENNHSRNGDDFLAYLKTLYERPDIKARFPNGF